MNVLTRLLEQVYDPIDAQEEAKILFEQEGSRLIVREGRENPILNNAIREIENGPTLDGFVFPSHTGRGIPLTACSG